MDGTIAALYAQTNYTSRVAHDAATAPQAAVSMSKAIADELLKQEQTQVQEVNKGDEARVADNKQEKKHEQEAFGSRRRSRKELPPDADDADSRPDSPLVGNLLNVKV